MDETLASTETGPHEEVGMNQVHSVQSLREIRTQNWSQLLEETKIEVL
jgi:hypothetical protein